MTKKGIQAEDLYDLKSIVDPQLSPNGNEVVFVQTHIEKEKKDYVSNLYYMNLSDKRTKQWTFGNHRTHSPRWSPNGNELAFVSTREGKSQIFVLSKFGGEAKQITFCKNGAKNPVWSPCGKKIAFSVVIGKEESIHDQVKKETEEDKELKPLEVEKMKYKSDSSGFLDLTQFSHIGMVNLETGEIEQLTNGENHYSLGSWSPDGKYVTFLADFSEDSDASFISDVYLFNLETKESISVTKGTGSFWQTSWSPNSRYLSFQGNEQEFKNATHSKVWIYDLQTKELNCFTSEIDAPVGDYAVGDFQQGAALPGVQWAEDNESFYFVISDHGNTIIYYGNISGEIYPALHDEQHVYGFSLHPKEHTAVVAISTATEPGELYFVNLQNGEKQQLTFVNQEFLQTRVLSDVEPIEFESEDGWNVHGWLMKPVGFEEGKKYPLILEIHGGPHAMYANTYFNEFQVLAAQGFAVLYVNPRGSHGYGQKFVDAVRGDYGGNDYKDLMNAVDYVLDKYEFIDKDRLGVTGGSYGGFMTNWTVGHTNRFKAAVTQRSISNWISFYGVSDIGYYFSEWQILADLNDIEKLWKHSPLAYAKDIETPLLIIHSEKDYRCPIEQAEQLFIALKRQQKQTKFIRFPESNHELSRSGKPDLRIKRLNYIKDWFLQYV
ncbi:S9 family peptidase [Heyndrickxia sporothermodurans]|uniref:S9 family peptidase n=2 Tax=Heyndrickxia sporothermodurans TaxID=46224 RepID=A0AB37H4W0_9BACI|nr:S9 family peptidase [Heyndrickxia sporothermodurans]MBL5767846.1 S9 family peptidase [Heyndrickxia sporothermodurans]MBL5771429.1 S9 family peptidase [Heyndrickxia sporothermodurans]MBL5775105.1 S9 family peptidase [Heyndrickxia sporothermodurans]MBL5778533.1 S9 family peptidase [Heyndrickxia sporothermodurans]MBL5782146.1 S9 family peptidase [Heyndrickxia sporothermodurans]